MDLLSAEYGQSVDDINRPKLSYRTSARHSRTHTPPEVHTSHATDEEIPPVNPDGEEWGDEEPYARPKLTYGAGLASNSKRNGVFP